MSTANKRPRPFFVGYGSKVPKDIASVLYPAFALFIVSMVTLSLWLGASQSHPGDGRFRGDLGRQELTGILQMNPYPVLRLPSDGDNPATTLMLSGQGKRGAFSGSQDLDGKAVFVRGIYLKRGDATMLQVGRGTALEPDDGSIPADFKPTEPVSLGKWRLSGEICDGKCYTGAMRPGTGLAHKACANLCIAGGVPAMFVSSGEVEGSNFFLLTDQDGNPLGDELYDLTALYIEAEGEVERLDDLNVFKMDLSSVKVLP